MEDERMTSGKSKANLSYLFAALVALPLLGACEEEGPAEKLGKQIDETVEGAADAAEEAAEEIQNQ